MPRTSASPAVPAVPTVPVALWAIRLLLDQIPAGTPVVGVAEQLRRLISDLRRQRIAAGHGGRA